MLGGATRLAVNGNRKPRGSGRGKAAGSPALSPLRHEGGMGGKDGEGARAGWTMRAEWAEESPGIVDAALHYRRLRKGSVET